MRLIIAFLFIISCSYATSGFSQSYYKMKPTLKKQEYFFNFLYPRIERANKNILEDRAFLLSLNKNTSLDTNSTQYKKLKTIANRYKVKDPYNYNKLLKKVDIVPPSMALAQAAVESGWGMSRFVKEANNIFGHWTYGKKGIVSLRRDPGAKHLIRIFDSLEDSIAAYMLNLNRGRAYYDFRNKRAISRGKDEKISGLKLSQTMINYSGIKEKYLRILKRMIKSNHLEKYDEKFYANEYHAQLNKNLTK